MLIKPLIKIMPLRCTIANWTSTHNWFA